MLKLDMRADMNTATLSHDQTYLIR